MRLYLKKVLQEEKRHAKQVMSAEREDGIINWIGETHTFTRKGSVSTGTLKRDVIFGQQRQLRLK